jgi:hypothetical protein
MVYRRRVTVARARAFRSRAKHALAVNDFEQALKIISLIGAEQVEEAALADLVPVLATSDAPRAMRLTDGITDHLCQVFALSSIASAPARTGPGVTITGPAAWRSAVGGGSSAGPPGYWWRPPQRGA